MLMPTYSASSPGGGGGLDVNVTPMSLYGFKYGYGSISTSGPASVTVTNAVGTVTYSWEYVSGHADILPVQGSQASTRFGVYADLNPFTYQAEWRCKATDSAMNTGYSAPVLITLESLFQDGGQLP